ncbi:MAG: hypothetical protein ACR2MU_02470, partial [Gaiellaceae bacterium]
ACLAQLGEPESDATMIVQSPVLRESAPRRVRAGRRRPLWPVWLALLLGAGVVAAVIALTQGGSSGGEGGKTATGAVAPPVHFVGTAIYDPPPGDGSEHAEAAPRATDNDRATFWYTQSYNTFAKPGVGLVLDAGRSVALRRVTVTSDTGFTGLIRAGASSAGPFVDVSPSKTVSGSAVFQLHGAAARYYVVWITKLNGSVAHVNEVRAG